MTLRDDVARMLMEVPFPSQRTYELADAIIPLVRAAERERCARVAKDLVANHERAAMQNGKCQPVGSQDRAHLIFLAGALSEMGSTIAAAIRNLKDE